MPKPMISDSIVNPLTVIKPVSKPVVNPVTNTNNTNNTVTNPVTKPAPKPAAKPVGTPATPAASTGVTPLPTTTGTANSQAIIDMITQAFADQQAAQLAKIQGGVNDAVTAQQQIITRAPQQFQPLRDQSEVQRVQAARRLAEYAANRGDNGGIGRMEQLTNDTAGANRLNDLNQQQQNVIDDANTEIARLQANGKLDEAGAVASIAQAKLQALVSQANADRDYNYQIGRDAVTDNQWKQTFDFNVSKAKKASGTGSGFTDPTGKKWKSINDYYASLFANGGNNTATTGGSGSVNTVSNGKTSYYLPY